MIPKRAIELAIEGGWELSSESIQYVLNTTDVFYILKHFPQIAVLDPTFWQALGKALGMHSPVCVHSYNWSSKPCDNYNPLGALNKARDFYDLILTGGDTEKFWEEILVHI